MLCLMRSAIFLYESSKTKHLNAYQAVWFNLTAKRCRRQNGVIQNEALLAAKRGRNAPFAEECYRNRAIRLPSNDLLDTL